VRESDDQLTHAQFIGVLVLGACSWAIIIGAIYSLWNLVVGLIIAGAGLVGFVILIKWLIWVNPNVLKKIR
jgi:hypothetical protein